MEMIRSAAIEYYLKEDSTTPRYMEASNHAQCIELFSFMDILASKRIQTKEKQGFMTTTGRFVDRVEAYQIAKSANQLRTNRDDKSYLDSYDLMYYAKPEPSKDTVYCE